MRGLLGWCMSTSLLVLDRGTCIILDTPPHAEDIPVALAGDGGDVGHAMETPHASLAEMSPHTEGIPAALAEDAQLSTSSSNDRFPMFSDASFAESIDPLDGADRAPWRSQAQYLVDNAQLHSKHAGLTYRFSKHMNDLDKEHFELYGTIITGEVDGAWLRVGDRYLPMTVSGKTVLSLQSTSVDSPPADYKDNKKTYLVVQPQLNSSHKGISFRWSKRMADRDVGHCAQYNSTVKGVDEGDGWLKVGDRFLPIVVGGKTVLIMQKLVGPSKNLDDADYTFAKRPAMWFTIVTFGLAAAVVASLLGPAPTRYGDIVDAKGRLRPREENADHRLRPEEAVEDKAVEARAAQKMDARG